jgi:hypothetical protein
LQDEEEGRGVEVQHGSRLIITIRRPRYILSVVEGVVEDGEDGEEVSMKVVVVTVMMWGLDVAVDVGEDRPLCLSIKLAVVIELIHLNSNNNVRIRRKMKIV